MERRLNNISTQSCLLHETQELRGHLLHQLFAAARFDIQTHQRLGILVRRLKRHLSNSMGQAIGMVL